MLSDIKKAWDQNVAQLKSDPLLRCLSAESEKHMAEQSAAALMLLQEASRPMLRSAAGVLA